MGDAPEWISVAALLISLIIASFGVLRRNPIVPASVAEELRIENRDLHNKMVMLKNEITSLKYQIDSEIRTSAYWKHQYEKVKNGNLD